METGNGLGGAVLACDGVAAMEPGLGDREWWRWRPAARRQVRLAAMEPGLGDREWLVVLVGVQDLVRAAMEPGLGDREWCHALLGAAWRAACRNGARSWRPGMVVQAGHRELDLGGRAAMEPGLGDREWVQWSAPGAERETRAAMEPGLGDREWLRTLRGPSSRPRGRNGARSWRPGMAAAASSTYVPLGVTPQWSPVLETGNGRVWPLGRVLDHRAAMEPGLGDREWSASAPSPEPGPRPQWSPVLETGNGILSDSAVRRGGEPQWSPVLETGNGPPRPQAPGAPPSGRNGARSWRPGMARSTEFRLFLRRSGRNGARSWRPGMDLQPSSLRM